ncbi:HupE/UreJ family protein [Bacillus sp. 03113]|uniref:HupE/UreJ family protein n=1 Tax=Bacillus sp. 03113 TaxID=2578211 RepID=UPI0015E8E0BF|nr:HupE/UreJ family protein [Bacillus sp. 03113]
MYRKTKHFFKICFILFISLSFFQTQKVEAHSGSVGYSEVKIEGNKVNYDLFLLADLLGGLLNIDKNQDGYMKETEVSQSKSEIEQFVLKNLSFINNGIKGEAKVTSIEQTKRFNFSMFRVNLEFVFDEPVEEYEIDYNIFYNGIDVNHQNFTSIYIGDKVIEHVFTKQDNILQGQANLANNHSENGSIQNGTPENKNNQSNDASVDNNDSNATNSHNDDNSSNNSNTISNNSHSESSKANDERLGFKDYLVLGMKHIWSGFDHLLFLFGLLLARGTYREYLKILTAFTVGHSITLALAASEIVIIPGTIIEPLIALSIVYVAIENIFKKSIKWRWLITLFFGLIHGFGFADIIIGKLGKQFTLPLFSFNLGVEIGQIVVLIIMFPFIWYLRKIRWQTQVINIVSIMISVVGLYWLIDRIL